VNSLLEKLHGARKALGEIERTATKPPLLRLLPYEGTADGFFWTDSPAEGDKSSLAPASGTQHTRGATNAGSKKLSVARPSNGETIADTMPAGDYLLSVQADGAWAIRFIP
jgi:hypothetical protein